MSKLSVRDHLWKKYRDFRYIAVQQLMNEGDGRSIEAVARELKVMPNTLQWLLKKKLNLKKVTRWVDPTKEQVIIVPLNEKESDNG